MADRIALLGYVLLGLLRQGPASGYDLRRLFATTPLMTFSDSPGAIYPALRRLEGQGLIGGEVEQRSGLRVRRVYQLTPAGLRELKRWLTLPVTREDVVHGLQQLLARFGFMDDAVGPAGSVRLLEEMDRKRLIFYFPQAGQPPRLPELHLQGSPFQRSVWEALRAIPWGEVRSYGEIAEALGCPGAARAVGLAIEDVVNRLELQDHAGE